LFEIREVESNEIYVYAKIPISFTVSSILKVDLINNGIGGIQLIEEAVNTPYIKDYDKSPEGGPMEWSSHFDLRNWGFFLAYEDSIPVAAAAIAFNTNGINMLEGRDDLSVLWDIRVNPEKRGLGIGKTLFNKSCNWFLLHGCKQMKIETQNINSVACHFYQHMGCNLGTINRYAYIQDPLLAHEIMLNWYIDL
jgi:GNAT superfamily N-acetyltransferase